MAAIFLQGDSVSVLRGFPDNFFHFCVTSPPYDGLRTYDGYSWCFADIALELSRVLQVGGVLCWVVGDSVTNGSETLTSAKQKVFFAEQCGLRVHDTMIYEKLNFSHPERVRYHQVFEYVFVLSKGSPRCFHPIKDKRNATAGTVGNLGVNTFTERDGSKSVRAKRLTAEFGMRGNVWRGKTAGQEVVCRKLLHPAQMPEWLARDLILSWSNRGDLVLDPFSGVGTTALVAELTGRDSISIDVSRDYLQLSRERLADAEQKQIDEFIKQAKRAAKNNTRKSV